MNSSRSSKTNCHTSSTVRRGCGSGSDAGHSTASNSTLTTPRNERSQRQHTATDNGQTDEERQKQTEKAYRPILPAGMFHEPHPKSGMSQLDRKTDRHTDIQIDKR